MSNHQFKKSEAEHHNELYALDRERERLGLQKWQMPIGYSAKALARDRFTKAREVGKEMEPTGILAGDPNKPLTELINEVDTQHVNQQGQA